MSLFAKKRTPEPAPEPVVVRSSHDSPRPHGPWDASERPQVGEYLDLGGMRILPRDGMELRLDADEETGLITSVTVLVGEASVQVQAFAAPRSRGLWDEIADEIAAEVTRQGGSITDQRGALGRELLAKVPMQAPDGRTGYQVIRFAGVNGPRWFLRVLFFGDAVNHPQASVLMEDVVRDIVVVRGNDAMAPRELLPLQLPAEATSEQPVQREPLNPFVRGPEITEVR